MIRIPIFLSSDNNYAPFVATTIASICDNTKSFCDFYVLDGGISEENKEKICELEKQFTHFSIKFVKIDIEGYFKNFPETSSITKSMYSRYLIPYLQTDIDKALYLDVDMIILGDIVQMYTENLEDFALGAVWVECYENEVNYERKQRLNLSADHKYFNSGSLVINCKKWRELNSIDKLLNLVLQNTQILNCPDQDVLNIYFDNNYKMLSKKFCFLNEDCVFYKGENEIIIRHFNGCIKPWHISPDIKTNLMPNKENFWYYAQKTAFYDELKRKTTNKEQQEVLLRHLKILKIKYKKL